MCQLIILFSFSSCYFSLFVSLLTLTLLFFVRNNQWIFQLTTQYRRNQRHVEGVQRVREREGERDGGGAEKRHKKYGCKKGNQKGGFDFFLKRDVISVIPVPYAKIIVLPNCILSLGIRTHYSYLVPCLLAMHICMVIRLISLDVLGPPAWRRLEFRWPNKTTHPARPAGWLLRLNKMPILLHQNRISK